MTPLVKKEIRLLLPSVAVCWALGLTNFFFRFNSAGSLANAWVFMLAFVLCGAMTVMLAISSFGSEISSGTFSNLLAQPISRQKLWDTKILVLAASLLAVGIFWSACGIARLALLGRDLDLLDLVTTVGTFGLVVFSGGLWTVLLVRQVAAAFWFTVLVPGVMLVILAGLLAGNSDAFNEGVIATVLGAYSLAGFFFARWLFLRAQDAQWTGGAISLPEVHGLARLKLFAGAHRTWRPHTAMFVKELHLHQAQFVIAGALMLLHLGVIATRNLGHFPRNSSLEFILECFWGLWLVMPVLVGCTAVAEERKLGTLESQLCLPARRRTQFEIKLFVALSLSILFGTIMPLLFEGKRILPDVHIFTNQAIANITPENYYLAPQAVSIVWLALLNLLYSLGQFMPFLSLAGISAGTAALSIYASTQARNTLQAIGPAVLGILLTIFLSVSAYVPERLVNYPLWRGWLIYFVGVPVLLVVLAALAYENYRRVLVGWNVWRRNLLTLVLSLALVMTATTALYHRVWELVTPLEPPHGAPRLTLSHPPVMRFAFGTLTAVLPGGRVWLNRHTTIGSSPVPDKINFGAGRFLDGTNLAEASSDGRDIIGIQRDGSLWISKRPEQPVPWGWEVDEITPPSTKLIEFGNDRDWKAVMGRYHSAFLLKTDGSLWFWGTNNWGGRTKWPGLRAFQPRRLGMNSDWAEIFQPSYRTFFRTTGGQIWTYAPYSDDDAKLRLEDHIVLGRAAYLEAGKSRNLQATYLDGGGSFIIGTLEDGTLRIMARDQVNKKSHQVEWVARDLPLGGGTNWMAMAGNGAHYGEQIITLKRDGSLWLWTFQQDPGRGWLTEADLRAFQKTTPVRLGTHSDWIALGQMEGGAVSLAADGSLWWWRFDPQPYFPSEGPPPLLMASRRPELLGNIFGQSD